MAEASEVIFGGYFGYKGRDFFVEDTAVSDILAKHGTPCYIYSKGYINSRIRELKNSFSQDGTRICYSVKANSNLSILSILKENGFGADVVSGGELRRAMAVGFPPEKIVFAGVGKREEEISLAIAKDIYCFNVENEEELDIIEKRAKCVSKKVACNLRLNLDVDVDTHHYIKTSKKETKFGLDLESAKRMLSKRQSYKFLEIIGVHLHIGSQIKEVAPYLRALDKLQDFLKETGYTPGVIDIGGGFGISYSEDEKVEPIEEFAGGIYGRVEEMGVRELIIEPGRFIMGNSAIIAAKVLYVKKRGHKNFVILDAGMNDLIRPSLYQSTHIILPEKRRGEGTQDMLFDVVGPICETGDYLGKDILLPGDIKRGDIVLIGSAGAYGFAMASNYNSRRKPCEVIVEGDVDSIIRRRETYSDLWKSEV